MIKPMKKVLAAAVIGASALSSAHAADEVNVAFFLEWATPNMIAKTAGSYDDAMGVDVNWVDFSTGTAMTEAMLAGAWLSPSTRFPVAGASVALLALYTAAVAVNLLRGRHWIDCGCVACRAQVTSSCSPHQRKTCAAWPNGSGRDHPDPGLLSLHDGKARGNAVNQPKQAVRRRLELLLLPLIP